jgi:hypothetical protein
MCGVALFSHITKHEVRVYPGVHLPRFSSHSVTTHPKALDITQFTYQQGVCCALAWICVQREVKISVIMWQIYRRSSCRPTLITKKAVSFIICTVIFSKDRS